MTAVTTDTALLEAIGLLADWLPRQRWFTGKDPSVERVRLASATLLREDAPRVWHVLVDVEQANRRDIYQVPLSFRPEVADRLEHVLIGRTTAGYAYDALHDKDACAELLRRFEDGKAGDLTFHAEPGAEIPFDEVSMALPVEQSNTSVAYGDAALLKVFRRIQAGLNPDVEVHDALTRAGSGYIAPLFGWIDGQWIDEAGEQHAANLAMLQDFLTTASDGWALATASVRDLYATDQRADLAGGDFAGEAYRLGEATAEVHRTMADALPTDVLPPHRLGELAANMHHRLDDARMAAPELEPYLPRLRERIDAIVTRTTPLAVQRIHGDFHLGQVVRTVLGWKLVDFEGEPTRPFAERNTLESPLRDVAGMLRSFDYAARHLLITDYAVDHPAYEQKEVRAVEWARRNREAFCAGYSKVAGFDPRDDEALLSVYETDKAVYEVAYEARHRPAWLAVPLAAVERLAATP